MSYRQAPLPTGRPGGSGVSRRRPPAGPIAAVAVLLVVLAVGLYLWQPWAGSGDGGASSSGAKPGGSTSAVAAAAFAAAWSKGDFSGVDFAGDVTPAQVKSEFDTLTKNLRSSAVAVSTGKIEPVAGDDNADRAALGVTWTLPGGQTWSYDTAVELDQVGGEWRVNWLPSVVLPSLDPGDTLRYSKVEAKRATILDGAGQPLIVNRPVVDIGIQPSKAGDLEAAAKQIAGIVHVDEASLAARLKAAAPDQFVEVITLRDPDFAPVAAAVGAVPGVVLHHLELPLSPTHDFARALLGTVGPVTKEIVDNSKGRYVAGDVGGLSGLEKEFDTTLGGTPGYRIDIVHPSSGGSAPLPTTVASRPAVDGQPLRTTLDQRVQLAADRALASVPDRPTALVAVRVSTGQVVAVANGPNGGGFDTALLGQVPPGSAFKIVTTAALLQGGLDVNAPVPCKPVEVVGGKSFHNYEGEALGNPPFKTDFAQSCNTAFVSLSGKVGGSTLPDTARALGIGACWTLGTAAYRGAVPTPKSDVDLAATAFGQGATLVSPVSLAVAAATVARGSFLPPQLVEGAAPGCAGSAAPAAIIAPSVFEQLRALMRLVVTSGTATVLASAPGGPVMAKTGTAEFGPANPPQTHAWLIGFQGDIAFAVYVETGKSGGTVAAPVALKFLQNLAQG
ncbi:MAG TPA: penicillin-binding transpeptidase domain-containing protein [Acidothermaceae bacterium]